MHQRSIHRPAPEEDGPTTPAPAGRRLAVLGWLTVYAVVASVYGLGETELIDLLAPALVAFAFAVWGFLRQGRYLLNASSLWCYATALFIAFPAAYASLHGAGRTVAVGTGWLLACLTLGVFTMAAVLLISPERTPDPEPPHRGTAVGESVNSTSPPLISPGTGLLLGATLMGFALVLNPIDAATWLRLPQSLGALSILVLTLTLSESTSGHRRLVLLAGVLAGCALYYQHLFGSFGRLVLGSIVCSMAVIYSLRRKSYLPKLALLAGTAPALFYLAQQRLDFVRATWNYQAPTSEGIASVTGPFVSAAQLAAAHWDGVIAPTFGSTVWATTVFWVPRSWWPGKPLGFGAEIVYITQPGNLDVPDFSDAATIIGEIVWNFGILFYVVGVLLLALWIRWLDRRIDEIGGSRPRREATAVRILVLAVLLGGIVNLVWGGVFTFTTRAVGLLVALGCFHLAWTCLRRRRT